VKDYYSLGEREHYKQLSKEVKTYFKRANDALLLTSAGLSMQADLRTNEPNTLIMLLLAKTIKNIRCSIGLLKSGYYSGASTIFRSVLETYLYTVLFYHEPKYLTEWYKIETGLYKGQNIKERQKLLAASKTVLRKMEGSNCNIIDSELSNFHKKANNQAHISLMGLLDEFDLDIQDVLPGEDEENALRNYSYLDTLQKMMPNQNEIFEEKLIYLGIRYQEAFLKDMALYTFYISHRLLDLVQEIYKINDKQFLRLFREWHAVVAKDPHLC